MEEYLRRRGIGCQGVRGQNVDPRKIVTARAMHQINWLYIPFVPARKRKEYGRLITTTSLLFTAVDCVHRRTHSSPFSAEYVCTRPPPPVLNCLWITVRKSSKTTHTHTQQQGYTGLYKH